MKKIILKAENISKSFIHPQKVNLLKNISLILHEGESLAIIGPSGAGKSTLLHVLGTLEQPTQGSLEIMGKPVLSGDHAHLRNLHIGFVFQNFNLLEESTVIENVLMPAKIRRDPTVKGSKAYLHAEMLLDRVGLATHHHHLAKQLSGGEKQRVALARAFCNEPELILADEPTGNLDEANSERIYELLVSATQDFGKALIVVTHNPQLAKLCKRQVLLKDGCLTEVSAKS